jgi:hypothetical protein
VPLFSDRRQVSSICFFEGSRSRALWYGVGSFIVAFQYTADGLNLWRFVGTIDLGVELVTVDTYLPEIVPKGSRGKASGPAAGDQLGSRSVRLFPHLAVGADNAARTGRLALGGADQFRQCGSFFGVPDVFIFVAACMAVAVLSVALTRPRTNNLELEARALARLRGTLGPGAWRTGS